MNTYHQVKCFSSFEDVERFMRNQKAMRIRQSIFSAEAERIQAEIDSKGLAEYKKGEEKKL